MAKTCHKARLEAREGVKTDLGVGAGDCLGRRGSSLLSWILLWLGLAVPESQCPHS